VSGRATSLQRVTIAVLAVALPVVFALGLLLGHNLDESKQTKLVRDTLKAIDDDYYRKVDDAALVNRGVGSLVAGLHDQFSEYFDPKAFAAFEKESRGEFSGVGMSVVVDRRGLRISEVFPRSPAARGGLRVGDLIVAVNNRPLAGRPSTFSTHLIRGRPGTPVSHTVVSGGRRRVKRLERAQVSVPPVRSRSIRFHGSKLGYVNLLQFSEGSHGDVRQAVRRQLDGGAKGIVLDLRGNPGGLLEEGVLVASTFIPDGVIVSTEGRKRPKKVYNAEGGAISTRVPLVVLVDHGTASAAEIVTGAVQDRHRGTVVGTRTYGKGVFQEIRGLPGGAALKLTVGEYFTPNGRNLGGGGVREGAGLTPDVRATDNPRTRGRDEALDVALRTLAARAK
jgi:carboxyl-terminal processing protease